VTGSRRFHLGWFQDGFRAPAWNRRWSGTSTRDWQDGGFYADMARAFERACFDYFMIEDSNYVPDVYGGDAAVYLKYGQRAPKHDPTALAAVLTQVTRHIGIVATVATSESTPFHVARMMSTLDHLSHGRIGWNVVTGSNDRAAQNFGSERQQPHDTRYDMADEFVEVVRKLWDSWDADAVVMDEESGVYVDHGRVRAIGHRGKHYASRGPLNTLRSPQGHPVLVQAGVSPRGRVFTARHSDSVIAAANDLDDMRDLRDDIRRRAAASGRDPDSLKVLFLIQPMIGETADDARRKADLWAADEDERVDFGLSSLASVTSVDFARYDPDKPLPADLVTNGHQGQLDNMVKSRKPLRELAAGVIVGSREAGFTGTAETVADRMIEAMKHVGGDGFLLTHFTPTRRYVDEICDGLVPELQRRGAVRTSYDYPTFKQNLLAF
jgi:FMN-dependent oxidoreductase (nitrilotriacetate monooxygenase family)